MSIHHTGAVATPLAAAWPRACCKNFVDGSRPSVRGSRRRQHWRCGLEPAQNAKTNKQLGPSLVHGGASLPRSNLRWGRTFLLKGSMSKSVQERPELDDVEVGYDAASDGVSLVIRGKTARNIIRHAKGLTVDQQLGVIVLAAALKGGAQ